MNVDRQELAAIFLGGAAGALARVGLSQAFPTADGHWPWAIFAINLSGALLLGYLAVYARAAGTHRLARPLLGSGFCGAFTTFSTLQLELLDMFRTGHVGLALLYIAASVLAGSAAVELGTRGAERLCARRGAGPATTTTTTAGRSAEAGGPE